MGAAWERPVLCSWFFSKCENCSEILKFIWKKKERWGAPLVAQRWRVHLPCRGHGLDSPGQEDPTCLGAAKPGSQPPKPACCAARVCNRRSHPTETPALCKERGEKARAAMRPSTAEKKQMMLLEKDVWGLWEGAGGPSLLDDLFPPRWAQHRAALSSPVLPPPHAPPAPAELLFRAGGGLVGVTVGPGGGF